MSTHSKSKTKTTSYWAAFIPTKISNSIVVGTMNLMRYWQRLFHKKSLIHIEENRDAIKGYMTSWNTTGGYIENQNSLSNIKFGKADMKFSGCEIIATYNALVDLERLKEKKVETNDAIINNAETNNVVTNNAIINNAKTNNVETNKAIINNVKTNNGEANNAEFVKNESNLKWSHNYLGLGLADLIQDFENDGMLLSGKFGTSPKAIRDFFKKRGYTTFFSSKVNEFENIARISDTLIMTFYNDGKDIMREVHTVSITTEYLSDVESVKRNDLAVKNINGNDFYAKTIKIDERNLSNTYSYANNFNTNSYAHNSSNTKIYAHNLYCNGEVIGPFESIEELIRSINHGKAKPICLIGIKA